VLCATTERSNTSQRARRNATLRLNLRSVRATLSELLIACLGIGGQQLPERFFNCV
jgi:hypothetical protein